MSASIPTIRRKSRTARCWTSCACRTRQCPLTTGFARISAARCRRKRWRTLSKRWRGPLLGGRSNGGKKGLGSPEIEFRVVGADGLHHGRNDRGVVGQVIGTQRHL